jgi:hypothetical protein
MTPEFSDPDEQALGEMVRGYLQEHPSATDTLEGIAEWWIERRLIRIDVEALSRVLEKMSERGILEVAGSGPNRRYRLKSPTR